MVDMEETQKVTNTLSENIAKKRNLDYGNVANWVRTKISFVLLRSAILCIRGTRDWKSSKTPNYTADIEITNEIGHI